MEEKEKKVKKVKKVKPAVYRSNFLGTQALIPEKPRRLKGLPEEKAIGKRVLFVANPVAGKKLVKHEMSNILESLTLNDILPTVYITKGKRDSTRYIREHGNEYDSVICSGGDGSFNEALTGMLEGKIERPLGYIPAGSTNIYGACIGIPESPVLAIEDMIRGKVRALDAASFQAEGKPLRYFNYIAAFGAFSWLSYTTSQAAKNTIGHAAYFLDAVKGLDKIKPIHLRVEGIADYQPKQPVPFYDEIVHEGFTVHREGLLEEGDYLFGVISNCENIAGEFSLPEGDYNLEDGLFEIMLIRYPVDPLDGTEMLRAMLTKEYARSPIISYFRAKNLKFSFDESVNWSLDGEMGEGSKEVSFQVLPGALKILTASTK